MERLRAFIRDDLAPLNQGARPIQLWRDKRVAPGRGAPRRILRIESTMTKDGVAFDAARFVRRLARALLGKDVPYLPQWWIHSTRLGRPGAAFRVCPSAISRDSVVYSFGAGEDISFDIELIRRFGVSVHSFDPTPKSIAWLRTQTLPPQFVFHDYGLAHFDGTADSRLRATPVMCPTAS